MSSAATLLPPRLRSAHRRRMRRLSLLHIGGLGMALALLAFVAEQSRSNLHFQQALEDLRAANSEGVQYELLRLAARDLEGRARLLRGWQTLQMKSTSTADLADVWSDVNDAAEDGADRALCLALMGRALYQNGQLAEAVRLLGQSLSEDPDESEAHRGLAVAWYELGVMPRAMQHLDRVAQLRPRDGGPHRLMGLILLQQGDLDGAITAYQESLRRDPKQPAAAEIRLDLARCLFKRQKYAEALALLDMTDDSAAALALKAECCHALGKNADAQRWVDAALTNTPDDADALAAAATLATAARQYGESVDLLRRAVRLRPNDYELNYRLMRAYRHNGDDDRAEKMAQQVETLQGLSDQLNQLMEKANQNLDDAGLRYHIADIAEQLGMAESAETWRKAARMLEAATAGRP